MKDNRWMIVVYASLVVLIAGCVMVRMHERMAGILLLTLCSFMVVYGVLGFRFK